VCRFQSNTTQTVFPGNKKKERNNKLFIKPVAVAYCDGRSRPRPWQKVHTVNLPQKNMQKNQNEQLRVQNVLWRLALDEWESRCWCCAHNWFVPSAVTFCWSSRMLITTTWAKQQRWLSWNGGCFFAAHTRALLYNTTRIQENPVSVLIESYTCNYKGAHRLVDDGTLQWTWWVRWWRSDRNARSLKGLRLDWLLLRYKLLVGK